MTKRSTITLADGTKVQLADWVDDPMYSSVSLESVYDRLWRTGWLAMKDRRRRLAGMGKQFHRLKLYETVDGECVIPRWAFVLAATMGWDALRHMCTHHRDAAFAIWSARGDVAVLSFAKETLQNQAGGSGG